MKNDLHVLMGLSTLSQACGTIWGIMEPSGGGLLEEVGDRQVWEFTVWPHSLVSLWSHKLMQCDELASCCYHHVPVIPFWNCKSKYTHFPFCCCFWNIFITAEKTLPIIPPSHYQNISTLQMFYWSWKDGWLFTSFPISHITFLPACAL